MTQLTDLQLILLSTAAQREHATLWPLPASPDPVAAAKTIAGLRRRALVEE